MPQLEQISTYLSQVVWLLITFGVLYLILWKSALPRIADILQERQERIDDDLQKAEAVKKEAEAVLRTYEATVAKARDEAQSVLREGAARFAADAAERQQELANRLAEEGASAEARIGAELNKALENVREVAAEVAQAATSRLVGIEISANDADGAVAETLKDRD